MREVMKITTLTIHRNKLGKLLNFLNDKRNNHHFPKKSGKVMSHKF